MLKVKIYLLGFVETEDDTELGLFYTEGKKLMRFEKNIDNLKLNIVTIDDIKEEFPQVIVLDDLD